METPDTQRFEEIKNDAQEFAHLFLELTKVMQKKQEEEQEKEIERLNAINTETPKEQQKAKDEEVLEKQHKLKEATIRLRTLLAGATQKQESKIESFQPNPIDLASVFRIERKNSEIAIKLAKYSSLAVIALSIAICFMMPLVRVEPMFVTFANDAQNFAIVQKADENITSNDALVRQLIGAYIINRETINQIDDQERSEFTRNQSSGNVWRTFENLVAQDKSTYTNKDLTREVKIINISIYKKTKKQNIATAEIDVKLFNLGHLAYEKRYKVTLSYIFVLSNKIDYASMPKNPTGFKVTNYSVTEIAVIKELDPQNRVNVKNSKSRIQYTNNPLIQTQEEENDAHFDNTNPSDQYKEEQQ